MKTIIVGAGIAGLAIGWRLAKAGASVEILERGVAGRGATWASAGMIAPGAELDAANDPLAEFARMARAQWRGFAAEIEEASGMPIGYREPGSLLIAENALDAEALGKKADTLTACGVAASWISREALCKKEPLLSRELHGALSISDDAQVDNRALAEALRAACAVAGVIVREQCRVRSVFLDAGRARGVVTDHGVTISDRVVLACGAWMNLVGGPGTEDLPVIKPVKGQMVACEPPAGMELPRSLVWGSDVYLVPRNGRLFVGASVEDAGFDVSVSNEARDRLMGAAARLIPAVREWTVAEMWAGLRPRSADDLPVLGASAVEGLFIASGQFRNGILFAPAVADLIRGLVLNGNVSAVAEAFRPTRFARP